MTETTDNRFYREREPEMDTTNNPPIEANPLKERLEETFADALTRRDELLSAVDRVPNPIANEEDAGKVSDFIKQITAHTKSVEGSRVAEKEPFLQATRTVDGWFKAITEPLGTAKKQVEKILTTYQLAKAAEERRRREEEERHQREEAERARIEADRLAQDAQDENQLQRAIEAEEDAQQAEKDALAAQRAADAKKSELSRTRGQDGAVASLRTFWDFDEFDKATLDLEALRQHIPTDALEKAVRSYVKAGGRELRGVRIFENATTTVR